MDFDEFTSRNLKGLRYEITHMYIHTNSCSTLRFSVSARYYRGIMMYISVESVVFLRRWYNIKVPTTRLASNGGD